MIFLLRVEWPEMSRYKLLLTYYVTTYFEFYFSSHLFTFLTFFYFYLNVFYIYAMDRYLPHAPDRIAGSIILWSEEWESAYTCFRLIFLVSRYRLTLFYTRFWRGTDWRTGGCFPLTFCYQCFGIFMPPPYGRGPLSDNTAIRPSVYTTA